MSVSVPGHIIPRRSVVGEEGEWSKMFDPPTDSPATPELLTPNNPVPAFVAATVPGATNRTPFTVERGLMKTTRIDMWDGNRVDFFTFDDPDIPSTGGGVWPGPTIRMPRGIVFHCLVAAGGPPPHTIHWHGQEPTPMNDGVGHCSMEIGTYTYQLQPNFIGSYFYHCHRNTMQHFEFGLYGFTIVEPSDAYAQQNPALPNYAGGYPRRTAANLDNFPQFPGYVPGDPVHGVAGPGGLNGLPGQPPLDPHAYTVPYDVEALWVLDDCDSVWRTNMKNARATFPAHGLVQPGVDDQFFKGDFHDFNPDYFFVTGVPFPAPVGGTGTCAANVVVPAELNSGVVGMQVPVNAQRDKTILVRVLCASYVFVRVTFPIDVVIIAYDGRALGVPPFNQYNHAFSVPAGTPLDLSTARRFDVLMRSSTTVSDFATVQFRHNRNNALLFTGRIPININ
ncbi:MAG: multicopper oxidase domain-containing protein [Thermodesulfovibrionales bacterium]